MIIRIEFLLGEEPGTHCSCTYKRLRLLPGLPMCPKVGQARRLEQSLVTISIVKVFLHISLIFVFDPTALPAQIAQLAVLAIWAGRAVGSKTNIKEASRTAFSNAIRKRL